MKQACVGSVYLGFTGGFAACLWACGCSIFSLFSCFVVSSFCLFALPVPPWQAMFFSHFLPWPHHMMKLMAPLSLQYYNCNSGTSQIWFMFPIKPQNCLEPLPSGRALPRLWLLWRSLPNLWLRLLRRSSTKVFIGRAIFSENKSPTKQFIGRTIFSEIQRGRSCFWGATN